MFGFRSFYAHSVRGYMGNVDVRSHLYSIAFHYEERCNLCQMDTSKRNLVSKQQVCTRRLKAALLRYGGPRLVVVSVPWYLEKPQPPTLDEDIASAGADKGEFLSRSSRAGRTREAIETGRPGKGRIGERKKR
jgi:hypothetical protein